MSLRILHISTRLILGGSQENTLLSCEGQARLGHEVHLAYGPIYGPEGSLLERVHGFNARVRAADDPTRVHPIATHEVPDLVREVSPLQDFRAYRQLRALIRTLRPDVVHTHSSKAGILGRLAAWHEFHRDLRKDPAPAQDQPCCQCRIVHTIHGPPFMPVDPHEPPLTRLKRRVNNAIYTQAERHAARHCHVIVSVADAMTREFQRRSIGRSEQFVTVYSGMETERFLHAEAGEDRASMRRSLGLGAGDFVVGTVARLAEHKGHDDVLDALHEDLHADAHLKLLWVGDGWWKDRLLDRARVLGVSPAQIITTGLVPPDRVPGLIRAMDVLVHPSYREGLPRTVPQAQLCGVAPIAYDCDGTPEAVVSRGIDSERSGTDLDHQDDGGDDGRSTGLLVPTGDVRALGRAVRWARAHPEAWRLMGERGRAAAAARFSAETMVRRLEEVYAGKRA